MNNTTDPLKDPLNEVINVSYTNKDNPKEYYSLYSLKDTIEHGIEKANTHFSKFIKSKERNKNTEHNEENEENELRNSAGAYIYNPGIHCMNIMHLGVHLNVYLYPKLEKYKNLFGFFMEKLHSCEGVGLYSTSITTKIQCITHCAFSESSKDRNINWSKRKGTDLEKHHSMIYCCNKGFMCDGFWGWSVIVNYH